MKRLFCSFFLGLASALPAQDQPNILFLFADDQCFETIRALGNEEIETPNLDRIVARSTTFTHAYNMGSWSGAVCVASRHMLNVGSFVWHAKRASDDIKSYVGKKQMWSQLMAEAGYDTYFTGKWHVKAKAEEIFQVTRHVRPGMPNQTPAGYNRPLADGSDTWDPADPKFEGFWKGGKHWSEITAEDAVDFLAMAKAKDNPFFMYVAFNAPHDPRQAPQEYLDMYPTEDMEVPANYLDEYPYSEQMKSGRGLRDEKLAPFPRTPEIVQVHRREYYALITHLDAQIGRILDALETSGKSDNTYLFYSADHGLAVGQHGLMGKQNLFDHSVRVPLMVSGPGVAENRLDDTKVYLQDVMATSLELGGAERPGHVQFKSLKPLLDGEKTIPYPTIYGAYLDGQRSIVGDNFKMILYPDVPVVLLFDTDKDPEEMTNLAENPEYLPKMETLARQLLKLQEETGDTLNLSAIYPELFGK